MEDEYIPDEQVPSEPQITGKKLLNDPETGKFVKGHPPVGGRPKGSLSLTTILKQRLELMGPDQKRMVAEHFADNLIQDALDHDGQSRKLLIQYIEGMPKQAIEHSGGLSISQVLDEVENERSEA